MGSDVKLTVSGAVVSVFGNICIKYIYNTLLSTVSGAVFSVFGNICIKHIYNTLLST